MAMADKKGTYHVPPALRTPQANWRDPVENGGNQLLTRGTNSRSAWPGLSGHPKPANETEVTTGSDAAKPANTVNPKPKPNPNPENLPSRGKAKATAKPANADEVTTGFGVELNASEQQPPQPVPSTSLREPFREAIELGQSTCVTPIGVTLNGVTMQVGPGPHKKASLLADEHIIKGSSSELPFASVNEHLCMQVAASTGG
jgi:hypothetical protein